MRLNRRRLAILTIFECLTLPFITGVIIKKDDAESNALPVKDPLPPANDERCSQSDDIPLPLSTEALPFYGRLLPPDYGNCLQFDLTPLPSTTEALPFCGQLFPPEYGNYSRFDDDPFPLTTVALPLDDPLIPADYGNCYQLDDIFFSLTFENLMLYGQLTSAVPPGNDHVPSTTGNAAGAVYTPLESAVDEAPSPGDDLVPCITEDIAKEVYTPSKSAIYEAPPGNDLVPRSTEDTAEEVCTPTKSVVCEVPPPRNDPVSYPAVLVSLMSPLLRFMRWLNSTVKPVLLELLYVADALFGDQLDEYIAKQIVTLLWNKLTAAARYVSRMLNDIVLPPLRTTVQRLFNTPPNALKISTAATPSVDAELQTSVQTGPTSVSSRPSTPLKAEPPEPPEPPKPREEHDSHRRSQSDSKITYDDLIERSSTEVTQMPDPLDEPQPAGFTVVATSRAEQNTQPLESTTNREKEIYNWQCDKLAEALTTIATYPVDSRGYPYGFFNKVNFIKEHKSIFELQIEGFVLIREMIEMVNQGITDMMARDDSLVYTDFTELGKSLERIEKIFADECSAEDLLNKIGFFEKLQLHWGYSNFKRRKARFRYDKKATRTVDLIIFLMKERQVYTEKFLRESRALSATYNNYRRRILAEVAPSESH